MSNRRNLFGLALVAAALSGCATVETQPVESQAARRSKDSDLYVTGSRLPRKSMDIPAEVGQVLNADWQRYAPPQGLQGSEPAPPAIKAGPKGSSVT